MGDLISLGGLRLLIKVFFGNTINSIDKVAREFLWRKNECSNNLHLVAWDMITRMKIDYRLGLKTTLHNKIIKSLLNEEGQLMDTCG